MKAKKKLHRLLSILLCFVLMLGLMPMTAFASGPIQNVSLSGDILSWDPYEDAEFYHINIDIGGRTVIDTSVDLKDTCRTLGFGSGTYDIELYAMDLYENRISDSWTGSYTYTSTSPKLATPQNVRLEGTVVKWNAVSNAEMYFVLGFKDGATGSSFVKSTSATYIDVASELESGHTYSFSVMAMNPGYVSSDFGVSAEYAYPSNPNGDDTVTSITHIDVFITAPEIGATPDLSPVFTTTPKNGIEALEEIIWYKIPEDEYTGTIDDVWTAMDSDEIFTEGYYYSADLYLNIKYGFVISESTTASINGVAHCNTYGELWDSAYDSGTVYICREFEPLHNHNYGSDWKSDADNHWHECSCGAKADEAAHIFKWVEDKKATATEKGIKHEECSVCGYKKAAVEIPATGSSSSTGSNTGANTTGKTNPNTGATTSPQTGNNSMMWIWLVLMFVSGTGVAGVSVYRKKKRSAQ